MRVWNLRHGDPLALRLAADVRLGPTDYPDDQIWELQLRAGEPPALAARTTYGLRARGCRIFPAFQEDSDVVVDPDSFLEQPTVEHFFVNYIRVRCAPLGGLMVTAEYWTPESHVLAGRLSIVNNSSYMRTVSVHLASQLQPLPGGNVMQPGREGRTHFLFGSTGNLRPVFVLEGGEYSDFSAWTALSRTIAVRPAARESVCWVQAARPDRSEAYDLALGFLSIDWEAEFDRIFAANESVPEIETGDPDWDAAFAFGLQTALRSYLSASNHLPHPSFVFTRIPDRGYSPAGDGSDYNWQWDGQVATEAYVNLPQVVMAAPELAKGVIRNFLSVQAPDGFIDWKPGLAGQRNRALCLPLLAACAWHIYEYTEDEAFISEVFPGLLRYLQAWFDQENDRDGDGLPEWQHTIQSAFDDCPSFVRYRRWGQGADITCAESPDLASYLYRECVSLAHMARLVDDPDAARELAGRAGRIRARVAAMWKDDTGSFHYVDRDTHRSPAAVDLGNGAGDLELEPYKKLDEPQRVLVRLFGPGEARPAASVAVHGAGLNGRRRVETLKGSAFYWYRGYGTATTQSLFTQVKRIVVHGVDDAFDVFASTVDYTRQDQTLLLPIWAGLVEDARLEALVGTITDPERYWRAHGIPNCAATDPAYSADNRDGSGGVWMMWNTMIGEGLADTGHRVEAAELIRRILTVTLHTLKNEGAFREAYNSDDLEGLGDRDYLWGVAPVHLFLRTAGIRIISPTRVWLSGESPFPRAVTVRHHGVSVTKAGASSVVRFPSGREVIAEGLADRILEDVELG
ncbi:MAG: hypothetical protein ACE5FI_12340 [Anaerolineales bacterium]